MLVATILQNKGSNVHTIASTATVEEALHHLADHEIGSLVVSDDGEHVDGILSERDIVRGLAKNGPGLLGASVSALMTEDVLTCRPDETGRTVLGYMTERRVRHIPVVNKGKLAGLVSIGDAVKARLDEVTHEADALREYIAHN